MLQMPPGVTLLERGWLSSNNIVFVGRDQTALVDSGYHSHAAQTVALVEATLAGRPLDLLVNTHLHSDHCGGNAALQARWPALRTHIPPGQAALVRAWDEVALSYAPTGQTCVRFAITDVLQPGTQVRLGDADWQVHAAPGHDPHSVVLFEPQSRTLISADALWEKGFGVIFPELDGIAAWDEVGATLDLIERLQPVQVLPGHGAAFTGVAEALAFARHRLEGFKREPRKHAVHAAKVLVKFKLLEWRRVSSSTYDAWAEDAALMQRVHATHFARDLPLHEWARGLMLDLVRVGAAARVGDEWVDAG